MDYRPKCKMQKTNFQNITQERTCMTWTMMMTFQIHYKTLRRKKTRENFCGTALRYKFLDQKPEAVLIKEKNDKSNFIRF